MTEHTDPATRQGVPQAHAPLSTEVTVPGSKSLTNRAILVAALARGESTIHEVLLADDTADMLRLARQLGAEVGLDEANRRVTISGCGGRPSEGPMSVQTGLGGTTTRFVTAACALGRGTYRIDADPGMRSRPMAELFEALRVLGAGIEHEEQPGHLPVRLEASGLEGGRVQLAGDTSSQFVTALLLVAPWASGPVQLEVTGELVSAPYVRLTGEVLAAFGASVDRLGHGAYRIEPTGCSGTEYTVEGDASAASYPAAAAAIVGGRVKISGIGAGSAQGDMKFFEFLSQMGVDVEIASDHVVVERKGRLNAIEADLRDCSDLAPTLAVVAAVAEGTSRLTGIGFIRAKESDRVGDLATELRRCWIRADGEDDGLRIEGGRPVGATVDPHGDHRLAMAFSLLGLITPDLHIADPGCVSKSWPEWWSVLEAML